MGGGVKWREVRGEGEGGGLLFPTKFSIERTEIILKLGEFSYREGGSLGGFMKYFDFDKSSFFLSKRVDDFTNWDVKKYFPNSSHMTIYILGTFSNWNLV